MSYAAISFSGWLSVRLFEARWTAPKHQDLHVLMTPAKAGGWGKTQRLNTTHPAVSRTSEELDLEDAIGVRLLDRSRPRGRADPWSARCSTDAATVFDDLRQAVRNIAFRSDPTLGEIKIGGK